MPISIGCWPSDTLHRKCCLGATLALGRLLPKSLAPDRTSDCVVSRRVHSKLTGRKRVSSSWVALDRADVPTGAAMVVLTR